MVVERTGRAEEVLLVGFEPLVSAGSPADVGAGEVGGSDDTVGGNASGGRTICGSSWFPDAVSAVEGLVGNGSIGAGRGPAIASGAPRSDGVEPASDSESSKARAPLGSVVAPTSDG